MSTPTEPTDPDKISSPKPLPPLSEQEEGNFPEGAKSFQAYMQKAGAAGGGVPTLQTGGTPQISPFDLAHGQVIPPGPTFDTIQAQAKTAQATLGDVSNQLQTPKLKLKQSTRYLLKNKLGSASGHILSAANKLGTPPVTQKPAPLGSGPIQKFLALVTDGQNSLEETQNHLAALSASGANMKPADMLLVQVKLNKAQQEIEFSSMLLSKAVDDLKQMMNIQL